MGRSVYDIIVYGDHSGFVLRSFDSICYFTKHKLGVVSKKKSVPGLHRHQKESDCQPGKERVSLVYVEL